MKVKKQPKKRPPVQTEKEDTEFSAEWDVDFSENHAMAAIQEMYHQAGLPADRDKKEL
jgi:hypothetical protein